MAIAHDIYTNVAANWTTATSASVSHAGSASARAACVMITQSGGITDEVSGVTYGGAAMTRVRGPDTESTEAGAVYLYWRDNVLTGTQTAVVSTPGAVSTTKYFSVATMTVTAGQAVAVAGHNSGTSASVANPSWNITGLTSGSTLTAYEAIHSGLQSMTATPAASWTMIQNADLTATGRGAAYINVASSGTSLACGWQAATADDFVGNSVAFIEAAPPPPVVRRNVRARTPVMRIPPLSHQIGQRYPG